MRLRGTALLALPLFLAFTAVTATQRGQAPQPAGPRINALVVSGGCCHDYALQGRLLMDAVNKSLPVDWTVVVQGGRGTRGSMPVYAQPDWSKGFDIVIHNECLADVTIRVHPANHGCAPRWSAGGRDSLRDALLPRGRNR